MTTCRPLRKCISSSPDELIIYGADNFAKFSGRGVSIRSSCDRALPAARKDDVVVLRGKLDREYHSWLRSHGLGPDYVVEYKALSQKLTLSELIIIDPDPILKIIRNTGRKPVYVPWFSGRREAEAARALGANLFGAPEAATLRYNDKAVFKTVCQQLDLPVIEGDTFVVNSENSANGKEMAGVVNKHLATNETVIIRGTFGEFGTLLYKTAGDDLQDLYRKIAASGEKSVIVEPFLRVSSTLNDQWVIGRDGEIGYLGLADHICERGMVHIGAQEGQPPASGIIDYISQASEKIVKHIAEFGYRGVLGIDYVVTDEGAVFPIENSARFNGSSYARLIIDNLNSLGKIPINFWKFIKIKTMPCSFFELFKRIGDVLYDGKKTNSVFPYNCNALPLTGAFTVMLLADEVSQLSHLEQLLAEMGVKRD